MAISEILTVPRLKDYLDSIRYRIDFIMLLSFFFIRILKFFHSKICVKELKENNKKLFAKSISRDLRRINLSNIFRTVISLVFQSFNIEIR